MPEADRHLQALRGKSAYEVNTFSWISAAGGMEALAERKERPRPN